VFINSGQIPLARSYRITEKLELIYVMFFIDMLADFICKMVSKPSYQTLDWDSQRIHDAINDTDKALKGNRSSIDTYDAPPSTTRFAPNSYQSETAMATPPCHMRFPYL
jgi:hypothetical protein